MQRIAASLALLSLLLLPAWTCDQDKLASGCSLVEGGIAWATLALPVLDSALPAAAPEWVSAYHVARAGFLTIHSSLVRVCSAFREGEVLDQDSSMRLMSEGAGLVLELFRLAQEANVGATTRDVGGASLPMPAELMAELEGLRSQVARDLQ